VPLFDRIRRSIPSRRRRLVEPPSLGISEYVASFPARWHVTHPAAPLTWPAPRRIGGRRLRVELDLPTESTELGVLAVDGGRVFGVHGWVLGANGEVLPELSWYGAPSERIVLPLTLPPPQQLDGTCVSLVSDWSCRNYAHFLLDALGRLAVLEEAGITLSEVDHVYCPTPPSAAAAGLLDRFGIPAAKRVFAAPDLLVASELLLVPSRPATSLTYPSWLPAFLRRVVRTGPRSAPAERRLYVSRRGFERRPSSEPELERVLRERGFEVYEAAERPTQPEDFDEAAFVVGPHGAGLANLAFCRPGTRVLEILPTDNAHPFYYSLSVGAGLDYAYIVGQSVVDRPLDVFGPSPYDFELDAEELGAAIDEWEATSQIPVRP
jgi:Glycosyltransferase 61